MISREDFDRSTNYQESSREPMSEDEIEAWLALKVETAMGAADGDVSENRQENLKYYTGKLYGDEKPGYSKVVTMEVFEAVEWALPSVIRTFMTGKFAAFIADGEEDEEKADYETDVVNRFIQNETGMFEWCHAILKDALIYPNGYLKVYIDEARDMRTVHHKNLTDVQVSVLKQDPNVFNGEVTEGETVQTMGVNPQTGQPMPQEVQLWNVKARYLEPNNTICIEAVPPEEVLVDNDLRHIDLDKAEFVCHHREVTRSELVSMGYDKDRVWNLPTSRELKFSSERELRADFHDEDPNYGEDRGAMTKIDLLECYAHLDVDDDGHAEYCRFLLAGRSELLEWSEWDYQPLIALSCYPQPHRHLGMSMADVSRENQRVSSVMKRQILDNMYRVNRPRMLAGRGVNLEQAMNYVPHGVVQIDGDVNQLKPETVPVMAHHIMPFIEYNREELDRRTGVSRHAAGLDADTLASSTMGAYLESLGQASQRLEMLVRNFAETGFKKIALKVHHLMRTRQQPEMSMKFGDTWRTIDPRQWDPRKRMTARVGIGTGSTKEKLAATMEMLRVQEGVREYGLADATGIWRSLEDFTDALGKPATESYFIDPESDKFKRWLQSQQKSAQAARQAEERKQALAEGALRAQVQDAQMGRQLEAQKEAHRQTESAAEQMFKAAEGQEKRFLEAAKLELDHDVDIADRGLEAGTVTPLRTNDAT